MVPNAVPSTISLEDAAMRCLATRRQMPTTFFPKCDGRYSAKPTPPVRAQADYDYLIKLLLIGDNGQEQSLNELIEQYQHTTNTHFEEMNQDQQIFVEMTQMQTEVDKLETGIRRYNRDDLSSLTLDDIHDLEQQLEYAINKVMLF